MRALNDESNSGAGWPAELRVLLDLHPRSTWRARRSPTASFWLEIHDGFRNDMTDLESAGADYSAGRLSLRELAVRVPPRLRGMVAQLRGHHEMEDFHYFPSFSTADSRLAPGFARLATDHTHLHEDIDRALAALRDLRAAAADESLASAAGAVAERYLAASDRFYRALRRHLDDEEDLVVPLLIERRD
jgi:hypothetical protein